MEHIRNGGRQIHGREVRSPGPGIPQGGAAHDALSDREYQVLRMLGSGRTVSDIAEVLHLSVKTVHLPRPPARQDADAEHGRDHGLRHREPLTDS